MSLTYIGKIADNEGIKMERAAIEGRVTLKVKKEKEEEEKCCGWRRRRRVGLEEKEGER